MTEEETRPTPAAQPAAPSTGPVRLSQPFIRERLPEAAQRNAYRLAVIVTGYAQDNPRGAAMLYDQARNALEAVAGPALRERWKGVIDRATAGNREFSSVEDTLRYVQESLPPTLPDGTANPQDDAVGRFCALYLNPEAPDDIKADFEDDLRLVLLYDVGDVDPKGIDTLIRKKVGNPYYGGSVDLRKTRRDRKRNADIQKAFKAQGWQVFDEEAQRARAEAYIEYRYKWRGQMTAYIDSMPPDERGREIAPLLSRAFAPFDTALGWPRKRGRPARKPQKPGTLAS